MAKPYEFDSPIITENGLAHVADIIETNYVKKSDTTLSDNLTALQERVQKLEEQLEGLDATLATIASELEGLA